MVGEKCADIIAKEENQSVWTIFELDTMKKFRIVLLSIYSKRAVFLVANFRFCISSKEFWPCFGPSSAISHQYWTP